MMKGLTDIDWSSLFPSAGYIVGVLAGLVLGVLFCIAFALVIAPLMTWLCRELLGDGRAARRASPPAEFKPKQDVFAVVVSDLHVDTWLKSQIRHRTDLLRSIVTWAGKHSTRIIMNGDLIDAPPHPNNQDDPIYLDVPAGWPKVKVTNSKNLVDPNESIAPGSLQTRFVEALNVLHNSPVPIMATVGNHDIGVNGMRSVLPDANYSTWTPGILIRTGCGGNVFVEHGHLYDPVLWIYVAYSLIDLLARGDSSSGGQRGGRVGKSGDANCRSKHGDPNLEKFTSLTQYEKVISFGSRVTRFAYRMAAYRRYKSMQRRYGHVTAVMMGHIHIPDRYQLDGNAVYVNTGDWAGNKDHMTFAVIELDGQIVGPARWVDPTLNSPDAGTSTEGQYAPGP